MYELFTEDGGFVAKVKTKVPYQKAPGILLWGTRAFILKNSDSKYYESFFSVAELIPEPVDRSQRTTTSGKEPKITDGPAPDEIDPKTGMHKDYWVLSDEERGKGFVRPVRYEYVHDKCGVATTMNSKIAETYARDPKFYGSTFCVGSKCKTHFPVGEFKWNDGTVVGS